MILLAALAGLAVTGGIALLGRALLGRGPDPGTDRKSVV